MRLRRAVPGRAPHWHRARSTPSPQRLDLPSTHIRAARDAGVRFAIDSDAHSVSDLGNMPYGARHLRSGWLTPDDVINTWPLDRLRTPSSAKTGENSGGPHQVYTGMDTLPGAIGLLVGAVSYMLGIVRAARPGEMALPTPCPHWDLATAARPPVRVDGGPGGGAAHRAPGPDERAPAAPEATSVDALRDRAAELLCADYLLRRPERFVAVGGLPIG